MSDPIPAAREETGSDGVRIARIDVDALRAWCRRQELPDPPVLASAEPVVATSLLKALSLAQSEPSAAAFGEVGKICGALDAWTCARSYFELAAQQDRSDFRWPYYLGCTQQVTGRNEQAIASFRLVLRLNEGHAVTHARLAQLLVEQGEPESAEIHLRRFNELEPSDWLGHAGLARIALDRGDAKTALRHLDRAQVHGEADFQVQHSLGRAHAALGNRERASEHFDRAAELPQGAWFRARDSLDQELHASMASADSLYAEFERLSKTDDLAAQAAVAEQVIARRSGDATMMGNLALLLRQLDREVEAQEWIDRALALRPDSPRLLVIRSSIHLSERKAAEALADALRALEEESGDPQVHSLIGRSHLMLGRTEEALSALERAVALGGKLSDLVALGDVLVKAGRLEDARAAYAKALAAAPGHPAIHERLQKLGKPPPG